MGREVKVVILHVEILLYRWSDLVYDEGSRETDERVCSWGRFVYSSWCFSVDDSEGDDQMDEKEQLLPSLVSAHEWIAGRDTLWRVPAQDGLFPLIIWYVAKTYMIEHTIVNRK